jgi:hypothetical protein
VPVEAALGSSIRPANLLAYPYLSLAERDRRWALMREAIDQAGFDGVILPPNDPSLPTLHGDMRWLTHLGGVPGATVAALFPRQGEPIAIAQDASQWRECQPWLTEIREAAGLFGAALRRVLRAQRLRRGRIGVARLLPDPWCNGGGPSYALMSELHASFPFFEWIDFSRQLDELRLVKSAEEVAFLEHSTAILERAFRRTAEAIVPGALGCDLWGSLVEAICGGGSDLPPPPRWAAGRSPARLTRYPEREAIESGWLLLADAEAAWGGYRARAAQPFACDRPDADAQMLMTALAESWDASVTTLRPGVPVRQAVSEITGMLEGSADIAWDISLRGCGPGGDPPRRLAGQISPQDLDRQIAPGWCLAFVLTAMRKGRRLIWGDTVAIRTSGPRRLGSRIPQVLTGGAAGGSLRRSDGGR